MGSINKLSLTKQLRDIGRIDGATSNQKAS
jgi:hypothetical protein